MEDTKEERGQVGTLYVVLFLFVCFLEDRNFDLDMWLDVISRA